MAFDRPGAIRTRAAALVVAGAFAAIPGVSLAEDGPAPSQPTGDRLGTLRTAAPDAGIERGAALSVRPLPESAVGMALDQEARAVDETPEDAPDDTPTARAGSATAPRFDLFEEPRRPVSATAVPSPAARPAAPQSLAGASLPEAPGVDEPARAPLASELGTTLAEPSLDPISTATPGLGRARPFGRVEDARPDLFGTARPRPASLANPLPSTDPDDAFAPIGIRAGSLLFFPQFLQTIGTTTNVDGRAGRPSGSFSESTVSGRLVSGWSRHGAEINASATYRRNFDGRERDDPRLQADGQFRLDLGGELTATTRGAVSFERDEAAEADLLGATGERPERLDGLAALDLEKRFGRLAVKGTASVAGSDRTSAYAGVPDESYATVIGALRAGYELSPALRPFAEASLGRRSFDASPVPGGEAPEATLAAARGGLAFDLGEKLAGEAGLGYAWSDPDGDGLETVSTPTVDALVNWSPRRGTTVSLAAVTRLDPAAGGLSADAVYEATLGVAHRWRARTDLKALVSARFTDAAEASGDETLYAFEAGATYWLNRAAGLTALYRHETQEAERAAAEWNADTVQLGFRLQR